MYVVSVTVFTMPEHVQDFITATLDNARNTRQELGNLRFDVLQCDNDPTRFMLYEAYKTKDSFTKHQQTPHYLRWKESVGGWMAKPREGVRHNSVFWSDGV
jgi:autoinducer 2-degrading protein